MEAAVFEDCRTLIGHFVDNNCAHFSSFCKEWKRMEFHQMFLAQTSIIEVIQTTTAIFHVAKRTLTGSENISSGNAERNVLRQIGGLYLMYAVYYKQPTEEYVKIDVSLETWREINDFMKNLPPISGYEEVYYIFFKLVKSSAFRYTALDYPVGLEGLVNYDNLNEKIKSTEKYPPEMKEAMSGLSKIKVGLPALMALEEGYNEMKEQLSKTGESTASLQPTNIFKDISSSLDKIQKIFDGEDEAPCSSKSVIGNNRRLLKNRASKNKTDLNVEKPKTKKSDRGPRRMSVRTIFSQEIPKLTRQDLEEVSDSDENVEELEDSKPSFVDLSIENPQCSKANPRKAKSEHNFKNFNKLKVNEVSKEKKEQGHNVKTTSSDSKANTMLKECDDESLQRIFEALNQADTEVENKDSKVAVVNQNISEMKLISPEDIKQLEETDDEQEFVNID